MTKNTAIRLLCVATLILATGLLRAEDRPRIRDLGVSPGILPTGELNAITDVEGVMVGHHTLIRDDHVRTGVTAVLPHGNDVFQSKVPAAVFVGNGYGKAAGFLQIQELGNLETPIVLTNTLSVGRAVEAVVQWTLAQPGNERVRSVNAIVGETNDGYLNDIRGMHVTSADVIAAIENARRGPVDEGSVGAGTGTMCHGFKGGIGTASRKLPAELGGYTVGALVQTNFGGVLCIDGRRVGEQLGRYTFRNQLLPQLGTGPAPAAEQASQINAFEPGHGSVMIVLATNAPLAPRNLERMARRAVLGLARTGSFMSNGSGDFVICFSTRNQIPHDSQQAVRTIETLENQRMSPLFLAVVESVEESVYNSLTRAITITGRQGHTAEAIPLESLRRILSR
jgi:D-aminopeptidase